MNIKFNANRIGSLLKEWRQEAGLTQEQVIKLISREYSSTQNLSNWERGKATPPLEVFVELRKIYRIPRNAFLKILYSECNRIIDDAVKKAEDAG